MQLNWDEHFKEIVVPACDAYLAAEEILTRAIGKDEGVLKRARYDALREGGAAVFYLHHFPEIVFRDDRSWLPPEITNVHSLRDRVGRHCMTLDSKEGAPSIIKLLGDVADSLKHGILTHRLDGRLVSANDAVLVTRPAYGIGKYGAGKFGGAEQVTIIYCESKSLPLSSVVRGIVAAWCHVASLDCVLRE